MDKVERTERHETTWRGTLTSAELKALIEKALRDRLGTPHYGMTLNLAFRCFGTDGMEAAFELVHDHDWFLKDDPAADLAKLELAKLELAKPDLAKPDLAKPDAID